MLVDSADEVEESYEAHHIEEVDVYGRLQVPAGGHVVLFWLRMLSLSGKF